MFYPFGQWHPAVDSTAFVHPTASLVGQVTVGRSASIWFHAVLRADLNEILIGSETNIQDGCLLHVTHHEPLVLAERITVGHGAILHGCRIESDCLIAMGAIVLDGARVGTGSVVAAGSVISPGTNIPSESLVMGAPGRVVRRVKDEDRLLIEKGWQNYVRYAGLYQRLPAE